MLTKTITLNGEEYRLRACTAAAVYYEQVKGEPFDIVKGLTDNLLYFWCMLQASNRDKAVMDFFDFVDYLDENPDILTVFRELLTDAQKRTAVVFQTEEDKAQENKKKAPSVSNSQP